MIFFNTPEFWYKKPSTLLQALNSVVYGVMRHVKKTGYQCVPEVPVIAIGGVTVGGAGKTPVARYIYGLLEKAGKTPTICLRGYGRSCDESTLVNVHKHTCDDVGDEALMLASSANVVVSHNRIDGIKIAEDINSDIVILDDGLDQRYIYPCVKVLVIDGFQGCGNGLLFPFGPLRDTLSNRLSEADVVIFINNDRYGIRPYIERVSKHFFQAYTTPDFSDIPDDIAVFSGLGMNEKFFSSLRRKFNVVKTFGFPDHYPYTVKNILNMRQCGYQLVTTEKDFQRVPQSVRDIVKYIRIELSIDNAEQLCGLLIK